MSNIIEDVQINLFIPNLKTRNEKQAYAILCRQIAAKTGHSAEYLQQNLLRKAKAESFTIGDGVALPNLQLHNIPRPFTALAVLEKPMNFKAADSKGIEFICFVLSPEREGPLHLRRLSRLSRMMKNPDVRTQIRESKDLDTLKLLLADSQEIMIAA